MGSVKRIWYLSPMRASKVQASLRIRAVSPEPSLLAHASSASRGTFRQKAKSLAPLNCWACAVKICHDGMLEDTNSLDTAQISVRDMALCLKLPLVPSILWANSEGSGVSVQMCRLAWFLFFLFGFSIKIIFSFWAESIVKWGENGRSLRKTTWPPASRTWLVSHVTPARLEPRVVRWQAI